MDFATFLIQTLNSVQYGLLLFMLAAGLTLIFGIMGVINLAHGSFYMIGAYMAYWPQKQTAYALMNGHTASLFSAYDGKALFATDHFVNALDASAGSYSNYLSGGSYDVSEAVSADAALAVLGVVRNAIASIKMANGEDPRFLVPKSIICGSKLLPRLSQLTNAKFLAQAATSGGGSGDVEVRPCRVIADEVLEKEPGSQHPAHSIADVRNVGNG